MPITFKTSAHANITMLDDHIAVDLLSMAKYGGEPACFGAYVLDNQSGTIVTMIAPSRIASVRLPMA